MRTSSALGTCIALLPLVACASARTALPPLELRASEPLQYRAEFVPGAKFTIESPAAKTSERLFEVGCVLLAVNAEEAARMLGSSGSAPGAFVVERGAASRWLAATRDGGTARTIDSPSLTLFEGQGGQLTVVHETAYVSDFELSLVEPDTLIADPIVDSVQEGSLFRLRVVGALQPGRATLEVAITLSDLQEPIRSVEARLPGLGSPVQIQQPLVSVQSLRTSAELAPSDCLLLVAPIDAGDAGESLFAFLTLAEVDAPRVRAGLERR